jgi:aminoglycoside 3-N-acetyltransferase
MPTHSSQFTDPTNWVTPPVPEGWWDQIREAIPAYDPDLTPTRSMGVVAETFRRTPGAIRSAHPHGSFAARGPQAAMITSIHDLDCIFGERSPLKTLYDLDALILLLGVDHGNNTCLHLAEYRCDFRGKTWHIEGAPINRNGEQVWASFEELKVNDEDFPTIGEAFANSSHREFKGRVGWGEARLVRCREIVDFAVDWMLANR